MYRIDYDAAIKWLDYGRVFPVDFYSGSIYPGTSLTNTEIKEAIMKDIKEKYEYYNDFTFEQLMVNPSFVGISVSNITVCKTIENLKIEIDGSAKRK